ncbi:MAG TPA: TldD/PmbA family protein, partial [Candidatus Eisenbacteria bacterium]
TQAGAWGFYHFDDEGWTAGPTRIMENGIFKRGLSDSWSARLSKVPRTANGRRQSWDHKAYARMSNTFFEAGTQSREELIRGVSKGILVGHFTAGIEDPKGWGMQVVCQYGEKIENGKLTGKVVSPVTLSGYVPDVLASVDGVGNDFELSPGTCGKGYKEFVPITSGGPTIRFKARVS